MTDFEDAKILAKALKTILEESKTLTNEQRLEATSLIVDRVCLRCGRLFPPDYLPCECDIGVA